ncbi:TonB-linked outer membrane protein, SusC/RagA family [Sphingobacterium nematocida]|uniref:TonB-linked outer membrane protein, SusC/RagA family n=2 Tax=Sphingobacterium nematocida TaxID=1513896 RepID=A0A1T5FH08_9SPHI|nr:TonB-linked outer membrane protein, SusC/RagA family [Sphingobacterium nematocida]
MKFNANDTGHRHALYHKLWLIMKLTLLFVFAALMHVSASTFAQRVTISKPNAKLIDVFSAIQKQTGVDFVYSNSVLSKGHTVSLNVKDAALKEVLDLCFKNQPFAYAIENKTIVVKEKRTSVDAATGEIQEGVVSGRVTTKDGKPLRGVTVVVKDQTFRGVTDLNGDFKINVPGLTKYTLVFSYLGMKTRTLQVTKPMQVIVQLEEGHDELDEVQVTGYEVIDKRLSTSAITSLLVEDILVPGMNSIEQALEGRVPELVYMTNSGEVGSTPRIRVRGTSTILGNREPLWVLDGFIMHDPVNITNDELNDPDYINLIGNAIQGINPQDIERVDILKDASATALYGTRAANGVIVVTTKKGAIGPARFTYNHSSKVSLRPTYTDKNINLMNSQERIRFGKDLVDLHYQFPSNMPLVGYEGAIQRYYKGLLSYEEFLSEVKWYETVNTDWFDILTRNSYSQDNTLGVSGGTNNVRYYTSLGYNPEMGVTKGTKTQRYTARVNLDFAFSEKLKANISINGNTQKKNNLIGALNAMDYAYNTTRALPFTNLDGSLYFYENIGYGGMNRPSNRFDYNIVNEIENSSSTYDGNTLGASLSMRYNVIKNMTLTLAGSYNNSGTLQEQWWGDQTHYVARLKNAEYEEAPKKGESGYSILPYGGILNSTNTKSEGFTVRTQTDYRHFAGDDRQHLFSGLVGFEVNGSTSRSMNSENRGFVKERGLQFVQNIDIDAYPHYKSWVKNNNPSLGYNISRQVSGYFSTSYSYRSYFSLNANTRFDASNKFGSRSNERLLPVWSVSGMWNPKEIFLSDVDFISEIRMRASFGKQGNMLDDQSPNLIIKMGTIDPNYNENVSTIARYPNPNLAWEQTNQFNSGLDISLFENRLNVGATFYVKRTKDLFSSVQVSSVNGVNGNVYVMNNGNLENIGYSLQLSGQPIKNETFRWNMSTYFSGNYNKVLSGTVDNFRINDYQSGRAIVDGVPISSFYSYKFLGLNSGNGAPVFDDYSDRRHLLENKTLEETVLMTMVNSGQREPIFSGSLSNSFTYRRFGISTNLSYSLGSKMRLFPMYSPIVGGVSSAVNIRKEFTERWRASGDEQFTNIPAIIGPSDPDYWNYYVHYSSASGPTKPVQQFASSVWDMYDKSDYRVVSGNYLKMTSLAFRYSFDPKFLKKTPFSAASMSVNGTNIFTISAKELKGQDPMQAGFAKPSLSNRPSYTMQFNVTF